MAAQTDLRPARGHAIGTSPPSRKPASSLGARAGRRPNLARAHRRNASTPSSTRMAAAATPQAEALARLAVEETGYGVVADKVQKNLFSSEQRAIEFIRPMRTVGVVAPHRGPAGHRDCGAVRCGRGDRAVHEPHVDRHLQDPDLAQSAVRDRPQSSPLRRALHHAASPKSWTRRRGAPGRPRTASTG